VPAVFPSVEIGGRRYVDGAVVNDVPVRHAVDLGARTVYVLEVGSFWQPWTEPRRPSDSAIQAYNIARRHRFRVELDGLPAGVTVHVLPHGDPPTLRLRDLTRAGELMTAAYQATTAYLDAGDPG
jgi:NTE family protein